jgi:hypothetical protein
MPNRYYISFSHDTEDGKAGTATINLPKDFMADDQVREFYLFSFSSTEDKTKEKDGFETSKGSSSLRAVPVNKGENAPEYNGRDFTRNSDFVAWKKLKEDEGIE